MSTTLCSCNLQEQKLAAAVGRLRPVHCVAMLSSVLNSGRAVQMNLLIIRAFVRIRELLASNKNLAARVETLEAAQKKHASIIGILAEEIGEMKRQPNAPKRRIGYNTGQ